MRNGEPKCVCAPSCRSSSKVKQNNSYFGVVKTVRTINEKRSNQTVKRDAQRKNVNVHQRKSLLAHARGSVAVDVVSSTNSNFKSDKLITIDADRSVNGLNNDSDMQLESKLKGHQNIDSGKHRNVTTDVLHRNRHYRKKHKMAKVAKEDEKSSPAERHHFVDWEAKIRSGFMGYDMPYPPNDVSVIFQFHSYLVANSLY